MALGMTFVAGDDHFFSGDGAVNSAIKELWRSTFSFFDDLMDCQPFVPPPHQFVKSTFLAVASLPAQVGS